MSEIKQASQQRVVMVESPYSGDIDRNIRYLQLCHIDCALNHNEVPYSSHSYMTQHPRAASMFVSDYDPKWDMLTREQAIESSHAIRRRCDVTLFYTNLGWSSGMKAALLHCVQHKLPYQERSVDTKAIASKCVYLSETFMDAVICGDPYQTFLE